MALPVRRDPIAQRQFDSLVAQIAALRARIEQLESARPLDVADESLRRILPRATSELPFTASMLWAHRLVDPELRAALHAACVESIADAGIWLRRHRGTRDRVCITRRRPFWRCTSCT